MTSFERQGVESFLNELLFQEGGVFTLFGEKPVTCILFPVDQSALPSGLRQDPSYEEILTYEHWQAAKSYLTRLPMEDFVFIERPCSADPTHLQVFFIHLPQVQLVLETLRATPSSKTDLLLHLRAPESAFWKKMEEDAAFAGIMYGYGRENIAYFLSTPGEKHFSDRFSSSADSLDFPLPIFASVSNSPTVEQYRQARTKIIEHYQQGHMLDLSIARLLNRN